MRRGATALAIVAVAGGLLAGCGSGPSQVGSAAIVGDTAIPLENVQDWFERVVADREYKEQLRAQGQFDDLARRLATLAVRHELLRTVAAREPLTFNEQQVTELIDQLGGPQQVAADTVYDEDTIRERARDQLIALELGKKYFDTTSVTFDYTQAPSRAQAEAKARELAADPGRVGSIVEQDIRNGQQAALGEKLVLAEQPQAAAELPLFSVPAGNVLAFPLGDASGQWLVALIRERKTDESPDESGSGSGNAASADRIDPRLMEQIGLRLLAPLAADIGVKLNPRYGVWDPVNLEAVQNEGEARAIVVPVQQPSD